MCDVNVVSIDSRGRCTSDAATFKEHTCALSYFQVKIAKHSSACCHKSKVAALCGLDMKVYFHKNHDASTHVENKEQINQAATLLCMSPSSGFAKHHIRGVAYVVVNDGLAPLSWHQVWGLVELINDASSYYQRDQDLGKEELIKLINLYRKRFYGPLSIYKSRNDEGGSVLQDSSSDNKPDQMSGETNKIDRKPFSPIHA
jgi:hypothetical protein